MNLPDWATHVAVDADGTVWCYASEPFWDGEDWVNEHPTIVAECVGDSEMMLPEPVARALCVAIPRPEREENE